MYYLFLLFSEVLILVLILKKYNCKTNYLIKKISSYEDIISDQGKMNHEYNNQLMILSGYIDNKKRLKEYLHSLVGECRTGQNYEIRQLSNLDNGGLKKLLYYKLQKMEDNDILFSPYINLETKELFESLDLSLYRDLTKLFGIFLDNSIDAATLSEKKEVYLDINLDNNYINITISNSYNRDCNLDKIGKKGYTTKGCGHGYGLLIVKDIIRRNNKLEVINNYDDKLFYQTILVDLK